MNTPSINDESRYKILSLIEKNPDISQRQIADELGVSLGKTNYCLKALIEAGLVKMGNFARSEKKLAYVYILTPKGIAEKASVTVRFLKHKQKQFEVLKHEIELLEKEIG